MPPTMLGLLKKARSIRTSLGLPAAGRDEFAFDPDSGISVEDQKEILRDIETVATQNRIRVSPEVFAVRAAKKGILFPVLVNLIAVIALAGGLVLLYFLFQRGESQLAHGETGTITAEGKLIEEVKRASEAKLQEKDQQITQIQGRLADIDKQRQDLQTNMDAKIREREGQLKASLAVELDAEKARLQKQGLSEQDINRRLSALEAQKNAESARQLAAYTSQAEADRQKADENLKSLQAEFNANLAKASQERQQVVDESRKREADLQAQLEQKTREAASAQAASDQALKALQSQKQQEDLAAGQLVGLYSVVKADIGAQDYQKAIRSLQAIRTYVTSTDAATLPAIAQRRDVDLFVVDSLTNLVQGQISQASVDTGSLVAAAGQINDVRSAVSAADAQLKAGNVTEAEKLYAQALSVIPEISRSYAWFTARARDDEAKRRDALQAGLTRAEAAFDAGRYAEMLSSYKEAFGYLPETSARLDRTLNNIGAAGFEQGRQTAQTSQGKLASALMAQAGQFLKQGRQVDAISQYLVVLDRYPLAPQAPDANRGISDAVTALNDKADATIAAREKQLGDQVALLQKQVGDRETEILGIKTAIMGLVSMTGDPASTDTSAVMDALSRKFGDLAGAQDASSDLSKRLHKAEDSSAALQKKVDALAAENEKLKSSARLAQDKSARLAAGGATQPATFVPAGQKPGVAGISADDARRLGQLDALAAAYANYTSQEDAIITSQGEQKGRLKTIGLRDTFLGSLDGMFKGLLDRVHRYDDRFIADSMAEGKQEGRQAALQQAIDIVIDLGRQATPELRKTFLDQKLTSADTDPLLKTFLRNLQGLPQMQ